MLKKIKKRFSYLLGAVLVFMCSNNGFTENATRALYGVTYGEYILGISIIFLPIIFILALIIGVIIYFKKKKKNAEKDEKTV